MQDLLDLFSFAFMQRALVAGLAIAVMAGILGTFIVQRGLAFLGDGLAHASFGGIALGALIAATTSNSGLLQQPLVIAVPFTILVALGIAFVRDHTKLASDTVIGVFFAVTVALAVLFISVIPPERSSVDVWSLLFGSILAVTRVDLLVILAVFVFGVLALLRLWPVLAYSTFDSQLAQTDGVNVRRLEYQLFMLAALITVVSAQVVGVVLMAAYLVIPAATARLLAHSLIGMTVRSVIVGLLSTAGGLLLSFYLDVPSGSMIILSQAALFIAAAVFRRRN
jgi:zinc transport system permease protein